MSIDISVILPVYNTEAYLERCIDSIIGQTHKNIEIIVVNDASSGNCREIVKRYVEQDKRVRCISHDVNKGLMQARITGVLHAKGKYVLHVDTDDMVSDTTCEKTYKEAEAQQADIVHYAMFYGESLHEMSPHFSNRVPLVLKNHSVVEDFLECNMWWTLCGKLFNRRTFLDGLALGNIPQNLHVNQTEDLALFFPVCCLAKTYISAPKCGKYYYFVNPNSLTKNTFTCDGKWEKICVDLKNVRELVLNTAKRKGFSSDDIIRLEKRMLSTFIWYANQIKESVSEKNGRYYAQLLETTNQGLVIEYTGTQYFDLLCQSAPHVRKMSLPINRITRIAIFSSSLRLGGAERVACLLADIFSKNDFRITLFTDEPPTNSDYDYDSENIERIVLSTEKGKRWTELQHYCSSLPIDLCIFNGHWLPQTMYDMLAVQSWGIYSVIIEHNIYFFPLYNNVLELFPLREAAYENTDAIVCLSEGHAAFWRAANYKKVIYIPNPLTFDKILCKRSQGNSRDILFVGRIGAVKGCFELLLILKSVLQHEPDARLVILGRFENSSAESKFWSLANSLKVRQKLLVPGHVRDVSSYYEHARVHVMPSRFEGAPMALMEAKAHGVPSVVFEMKYLGSTDITEGCVMVGKNDVPGMAKAVLTLLQDDEKWHKMSDKALASLDDFSNEIVLSRWKTLINSIEHQDYDNDMFKQNHCSEGQLAAMLMTEFNCAIKHSVFDRNASSLPHYLKLVQRVLDYFFPHNSYRRSLFRKLAKKIYNILMWCRQKFHF